MDMSCHTDSCNLRSKFSYLFEMLSLYVHIYEWTCVFMNE